MIWNRIMKLGVAKGLVKLYQEKWWIWVVVRIHAYDVRVEVKETARRMAVVGWDGVVGGTTCKSEGGLSAVMTGSATFAEFDPMSHFQTGDHVVLRQDSRSHIASKRVDCRTRNVGLVNQEISVEDDGVIPHKGVKASANSDIMYFFTSAQDGDPLQDDVRLCLGDDLKKAQDHNQRQV
ncbi:hypothetical protein Tco_1109060 [Tanacetum coccineum]